MEAQESKKNKGPIDKNKGHFAKIQVSGSSEL